MERIICSPDEQEMVGGTHWKNVTDSQAPEIGFQQPLSHFGWVRGRQPQSMLGKKERKLFPTFWEPAHLDIWAVQCLGFLQACCSIVKQRDVPDAISETPQRQNIAETTELMTEVRQDIRAVQEHDPQDCQEQLWCHVAKRSYKKSRWILFLPSNNEVWKARKLNKDQTQQWLMGSWTSLCGNFCGCQTKNEFQRSVQTYV